MKTTAAFSRSLRTAFALSLACAGFSQGAVLYSILSFDATDATTTSSTTASYDPALVSITTASGLTGTTAAQLNSLQTINPDATINSTGLRFRNTDADAAQGNGTLVTDASTAGYFQFGISGGSGALTLTDLTFKARQATNGTSTRGYSISASVNGGTYNLLNATNISENRNNTFATISPTVLNLSAAEFQNINSIDFRVKSTIGGIEYLTFSVNGAVPEPSTSLLSAALGALLLLRRRK